MKKLIPIILTVTAFSLIFVTGCGSTPKESGTIKIDQAADAVVQESETTTVPEEKNVSVSQTELPEEEISTSENNQQVIASVSTEADITDVPSEKIDESEILPNPVLIEEAETFTEPEVQDAVEENLPEYADSEELDENSLTNGTIPVTALVTDENKKSVTPESQAGTDISKKISSAAAPISKPDPENKTTQKTESSAAAVISPEKNMTQAEAAAKAAKNTQEVQSESDVDIFNNLAVIVPSRAMKVKTNQFVDVVYPGSGWIYIGETETDGKFRYFGRKLGSENTTFTLRSVKPGKTYLHFYKNDVLTAQYIDDYLEVEVVKESAKANEKATAPSYAEVVPPKPVRSVTTIKPETNSDAPEDKLTSAAEVSKASQAKKTTASTDSASKTNQGSSSFTTSSTEDNNVKTIISSAEDTSEKKGPAISTSTSQSKTTPAKAADTEEKTQEKAEASSAVSEKINLDPGKSLLEQAKASLKAQKYELALAQIQSYLDTASSKIDEAYYVQGQILESDSNVKNIRSAIDSYDTVIKKYPASKFWSAANKRKIFLNRFYVNIY